MISDDPTLTSEEKRKILREKLLALEREIEQAIIEDAIAKNLNPRAKEATPI